MKTGAGRDLSHLAFIGAPYWRGFSAPWLDGNSENTPHLVRAGNLHVSLISLGLPSWSWSWWPVEGIEFVLVSLILWQDFGELWIFRSHFTRGDPYGEFQRDRLWQCTRGWWLYTKPETDGFVACGSFKPCAQLLQPRTIPFLCFERSKLCKWCQDKNLLKRSFCSQGPNVGKLMEMVYPIGSMYAIYGNIYHQYIPNVRIYTIHGSYGYVFVHLGHVDLPDLAWGRDRPMMRGGSIFTTDQQRFERFERSFCCGTLILCTKIDAYWNQYSHWFLLSQFSLPKVESYICADTMFSWIIPVVYRTRRWRKFQT